MSLILDALRKAERERELGQVPTIGSQLPLRRRPVGGRHRRWIVGISVIALAGTVVAAWALREAWWPAAETTETVAATGAEPPAESAPGAAAGPTAATPQVAVPAPTVAPGVAAPDPAEEARRVAEQALAVAEAAKRDAEEAKAAAVALPDVGSVAASVAPADTAPSQAPVEPVPAMTAPQMPEPAGTATAGTAIEPDAPGEPRPVPVAEVAKPVAEPPASEPPPPPVPLVWELPLGVRQSLPALSIAMHVYAEEPTRRFVILNDARLVEGESAGAGVTVREIRRDGVVLEHQGQRFLLPRGGL